MFTEATTGARDIDRARKYIFDIMQRHRDEKVFYFHGWSGFGAAPVLGSIVKELQSIRAKNTPPELCFDRIIYIDCSAWENRRVMQRKIAEELELGLGMMAKFEEQDEEDDFSGVDHASRDVIPSVWQAVAQTLMYRKMVMVFLNGADDMIDVSRFGISPEYCDHVIIWTFKRRSLTIQDEDRRSTEILRSHTSIKSNIQPGQLTSSEFSALLCEEAANIVARHPSMRGMDVTMVTECCLYELFLQHSFHRATGLYWEAHAPSYWMCDGIIKGDGTSTDISDTLHQEIHWEINALQLGRVFKNLMGDPKAPFFLVEDNTPLLIERPYRWICVTSKNLVIQEDMKAILPRASSLFVALEKSDNPQGLPNGFLKHCSNLGVLILSHCAFSFVSPPFLWCHRLRFLGLDHCTYDSTCEGENNTNWTWLQNLWVLDLRYTEWDDILSEEKMHNMDKLRELNIEGFLCWQLAARIHGKLPYLRRLRIIKPMHKADTSIDSSNKTLSLFVDKTELEVLDLTGNRDMENLSISSSMARSLQMLILDGCDGLENVVVPDGLPSSLRSFSFDGYGPATRWTSSFKLHPKSSKQKHIYDNADTSAVKISNISLQGCTQFENLYVRGLPNLEELDLSGSAIKVLDFGTMVIDVPRLKRLILLGCEHLRAIKWESGLVKQLELVCVDTRPRRAHGFARPCLVEHKSFVLQLHATLADARLARSLCRLMYIYNYVRDHKRIYFNIHVTSSFAYGGDSVQLETTREETIEPSRQQHHVEVIPYGDTDTFFKVGDALTMSFFPQPPTQQLDCHIEISDGSRGLEDELGHIDTGLAQMMSQYVESLHVHDASTSASMYSSAEGWRRLEWCRMERCPNLGTIFPASWSLAHNRLTIWASHFLIDNKLHTIWASHLLMVRCIWSKGHRGHPDSFRSLRHLHLRCCPRLQFVQSVWVTSFPSLETLHIIHCGDLRHVFVLDNDYAEEIRAQGLRFPKLTTIHLHDLPKLQQICEVKMLAPALQTIRIRGCFALRRLPAVAAREPGAKKPAVEIEKDVWDSLEWDGELDAGHHRDLFEPPVHSRYYRRSRLLRGTVLR